MKQAILFAQFVDAYPASRRHKGARVREAFAAALEVVEFDELLTALEQHTRSLQWKNPRFIPSMITWLEEERWCQTLPEVERRAADEQRLLNRLTPFERAKRAGLK